mgnify:FL=1
MKSFILLFAAFLGASTAARAETIVCPDAAGFIQVGACPSEEELQFTFNGYCSDNARMFDKPEEQLCTDYTLYRSLKNYARYETTDGRFSGYVSCELKTPLTKARAVRIKVDKQGSITRFACGYDSGASFTYRTKSKCTIAPGAAEACARDPLACKAECD